MTDSSKKLVGLVATTPYDAWEFFEMMRLRRIISK
jgi:hypothetical protein